MPLGLPGAFGASAIQSILRQRMQDQLDAEARQRHILESDRSFGLQQQEVNSNEALKRATLDATMQNRGAMDADRQFKENMALSEAIPAGTKIQPTSPFSGRLRSIGATRDEGIVPEQPPQSIAANPDEPPQEMPGTIANSPMEGPRVGIKLPTEKQANAATVEQQRQEGVRQREEGINRELSRDQAITQRNTTVDAETARHNKAMEARPVAGPSAAAAFDPGGLELAATAYRLTNALPGRSTQANAAILNEAAKQNKALGHTPVAMIQRQAARKADTGALAQITKMASSAEAYESKAIAQAGLVGELSKQVPRTAWPAVNGLVVSGQIATGNTPAQLFTNALITFTNEYAKIMEGSTGSVAGSSDLARKDAARLISTALTNGTIQKTLDQMQWEMRKTIEGYDTVIGHINDKLGGNAGQPSATVPPGKNNDPLGIR